MESVVFIIEKGLEKNVVLVICNVVRVRKSSLWQWFDADSKDS